MVLVVDEEYSRLQLELIRSVGERFDKLSPRERDILKLRFGLDDGKSRTLQEVGELFGVNSTRVMQIESRALRKLRYGEDDSGSTGAPVPRVPIEPDDEASVKLPLPEQPDETAEE